MISRTSTVSVVALLLASAGAAAAFPATVTTDLNVRSGPGTGYGVVDRLQAGDSVEVISSQGSWYQVAGGGWASANYLDADGGRVAVEPSYEVVGYPAYYGSPAFYYGSDPYFWDDAGYYFYWRGGRRHNVDHDWFRDHDRSRFRFSNNSYRNQFDGYHRGRGGDGPRRGQFSGGGQGNGGNNGGSQWNGNQGQGGGGMMSDRASVQGAPGIESNGGGGDGMRGQGGFQRNGGGMNGGGNGNGGMRRWQPQGQ